MKLKSFTLKILTSCWLVIILFIIAVAVSETRLPSEGVWKQKGFGRIMKIDNEQFVIYSRTEGYCNQLTSGNFDEHFRIVDETEKELVINYGSLRNYYFTKIDELPKHCSSRKENQNFDPLYNFNVLWSFFNDNYAFFKSRGIDWDQTKTDFLPRIADIKSQLEFYQIVKELLDSFDDGHINLNVPDSLNQQTDNTAIGFERIKNEIPEAILATYVDAPKTYN